MKNLLNSANRKLKKMLVGCLGFKRLFGTVFQSKELDENKYRGMRAGFTPDAPTGASLNLNFGYGFSIQGLEMRLLNNIFCGETNLEIWTKWWTVQRSSTELLFINLLFVFVRILSQTVWLIRPRGYKTFFRLNSTEHLNFPAHKC